MKTNWERYPSNDFPEWLEKIIIPKIKKKDLREKADSLFK